LVHELEDATLQTMLAIRRDLDNATWHSTYASALSRYTVKDPIDFEPADKDPHHLIEFPDEYALFRQKDSLSWIVFFVLFIFLIVLDNTVLQSSQEKPSFYRALAYTAFWLSCAFGFNIYVWFARGPEDAFAWGTGYILEWMLSVDNLFVFRSVFLTFNTPDDQKHKPLFWGIVGAVIFRMIFFAVGEVLLHTFTFMHYLLGAFLIYTGIKIMAVEEDDEEFEESFVLQKVKTVVPYVNCYAPTAKFFARLPDPTPTPRGMVRTVSKDREASPTNPTRPPLRATRLLLVVICLELTDIVFAVDSVSAIVAQIPDLFLAYTACVFAMLGLRATFFVVDELVKLFSLLSYGVAAILIFIGVKLCLRSYIHVPHEYVCVILVSTLILSMLASWVYDKIRGPKGTDSDGSCEERKPQISADSEPEVVESIAARA